MTTKVIQPDKRFEKNFRRRIARDKKLNAQFRARLQLFVAGERGHPVNDHSLVGPLSGLRAWSVTGDVRVIYRETADAIIFLDIGTHAQVYK